MAEKKRSKKLRLFLAALVVFVVVALVALLLAPTIASAGFARGIILGFVNDAIPGRITVDSWSLSWGGPQKINGLGIEAPDGGKVLTVKSIHAPDLSLFAAIRGSTDYGLITLDGIDGSVEQYDDGSTNLQRALVADDKAKDDDDDTGETSGGGGGMPSARIEWTNANLSVTAPGIEPVTISNLTGHADLTNIAQIDLALAASVKQGATAGKVDAKAKVTDLFNASGDMQWVDAGFDADVKLTDLPVDAVDRIAAQGGKLTALLGPILNADVKASGKLSSSAFTATIQAQSENLTECKLVAGYKDDHIVLEPKSGLSLRVTPAAWRALTATEGKPTAALVQPFTLRADVAEFRVLRDYRKLVGAANITFAVDDIVLDAADERIGRVALRNTRAALEAADLAKAVTVTLDAVAEQGGRSGAIKGAATLHTVDNTFTKVNADLAVTDAPLAVFDQLASTDGMIVNALGDTITATAKADYDMQANLGDVTITATSSTLTANLVAKADDRQIAVASGGKLQYTLSPAFAHGFLGEKRTVTLLEPVKLNVAVNNLVIPRSGETIDMHSGKVDVAVKGDDIRLSDGNTEPLVFAAPTFSLRSDSMGKTITADGKTTVKRGLRTGEIAADVKFTDAFTKDGQYNAEGMHVLARMGASPNLLGSVRPVDQIGAAVGKLAKQPFKLSLEAQMIKPTVAGKSAATFTYTLEAGEINVNAPGKIDGDRLILNDGAAVTVLLDQNLFAALTGGSSAEPAPYTLTNEAKIALNVKTFDMMIAGDNFGEGELDLTFTSDELKLAATDANAAASTIELKKVKAAIKAENARELIAVGGGADVVTAGQTANIAVAAGIKDAFGTPTLTRAQLKAPSLPTALVDALSGPDSNLAALLGQTLAVDIEAEPAGEATAFDATVTAPNLPEAKAAGTFTSGKSARLDTLTARYTLTPAAFTALRPQPTATVTSTAQSALARRVSGSDAQTAAAWTLQKPATFTVSIPKAATIGLTKDNAVDYRTTSLTLAVTGEELQLTQGSTTYALRGLQADVDMAKPAEAIVITAKADMSQVGGAGGGKLTSTTRLTNALAADGSLDLVNSNITTDTQGKTLPSVMLDALAGTDQQLSQMFGPLMEITATGSYPGNLDLAVVGDLGDVRIPINVDAQRVLTLQRDGSIKFVATTELADTVLRNINPFLADTVRGRDPIQITLKKEGTHIPLRDFKMANASAVANVNLGTLELGEGGFIGKLRGFLKKSSRSSYNAKFSPTDVKLLQGWVSYTGMRMEIEDENLAIVYSGRMHVDPDSGRELEMNATIPGDSLGAAIKELRGVLGPNEGLTIPIRGTIDEPKPDFGGFQKSIADMAIKAGIRRGIGEALGGDDATGEAAGALIEGLFGGKKK